MCEVDHPRFETFHSPHLRGYSNLIYLNRIGDGEEIINHSGGGSGGYLEHVIKYAAKELFCYDLEKLTYKTLRYIVKLYSVL